MEQWTKNKKKSINYQLANRKIRDENMQILNNWKYSRKKFIFYNKTYFSPENKQTNKSNVLKNGKFEAFLINKNTCVYHKH